MKSANFPAVRVEPELRDAAENVLREGETLSNFVEQSIRLNIERRQAQDEFIARGLAARDRARRTGDYIDADEVLRGLQAKLDATRAAAKKQRSKSRA